jgi:hypothetical protein
MQVVNISGQHEAREDEYRLGGQITSWKLVRPEWMQRRLVRAAAATPAR